MYCLALEKPIVELEKRIEDLRLEAARQGISVDSQIVELEEKLQKVRRDIFASLTEYEITQLARHPKRPNSLEIVQTIADDFIELHGDRNFQDDPAIVSGLAVAKGMRFVFVGHQKGRTTKENIRRNFAMPRPEGYRKALRMMSLAERFKLPIITLIDTPGAYPGIGAEERGQSEAIAKNIMVMTKLKVPILAFVIGEGGSGGALAIAVADKVFMLQYSIYSVISPEGCASILFKSAAEAPRAAEALQVSAQHALRSGLIDGVIEEPEGGAHRSLERTAASIFAVIERELLAVKSVDWASLRARRAEKFLSIGNDALNSL